MLLAEDQDGSVSSVLAGEDEAFGEAVRARAARRDLHVVYRCASHDGVECGAELSGAVADEEPDVGLAPTGARRPGLPCTP